MGNTYIFAAFNSYSKLRERLLFRFALGLLLCLSAYMIFGGAPSRGYIVMIYPFATWYELNSG